MISYFMISIINKGKYLMKTIIYPPKSNLYETWISEFTISKLQIGYNILFNK
jgi:hypothetical protein